MLWGEEKPLSPAANEISIPWWYTHSRSLCWQCYPSNREYVYARFEVQTLVPTNFSENRVSFDCPEDGCSKLLRNIGNYMRVLRYIASCCKMLHSSPGLRALTPFQLQHWLQCERCLSLVNKIFFPVFIKRSAGRWVTHASPVRQWPVSHNCKQSETVTNLYWLLPRMWNLLVLFKHSEMLYLLLKCFAWI